MAPQRRPLASIDANVAAGRVAEKRQTVKSLEERVVSQTKPIQRTEISWTREKKVRVLAWLHSVRISVPEGQQPNNHWRGWCKETRTRLPTCKEAEAQFGGDRKQPCEGTIKSWLRQKDVILHTPRRRCYQRSAQEERYPEIEQLVYEAFVKRRADGLPAGAGWIRRRAYKIAKEKIGDEAVRFAAKGWLYRWCKRYSVAKRRVTKESQKRPEEYFELASSFVRFCRRQIATPLSSPSLRLICNPTRRINATNILNMDEVPVPFEFLDGYTYDFKGAKTISVDKKRSGWSKRQATLILYIFADGEARLKPKLIFHGAADNEEEIGRIRKKESEAYDKRVTVEYNLTAYNNADLMLRWVIEELLLALFARPSLLVMDHASFHKTVEVRAALDEGSITPAIIPGGCTSLLQPLDVAINRPLKDLLRQRLSEKLEEHEEAGYSAETTSSRRILLTQIVADVWEKFEREEHYKEMIRQSFIHTGINIAVDGSENSLISIKDIKEEIDFTGWESQEQVIKEETFVDGDLLDLTEDLNQLLENKVKTYTNQQLKAELRRRGQRLSGNKVVL